MDEPAFDRLSVLPTDILVTILSLLTAKEATATCVLSRSWKYLWVFATSAKLNFDGTHSLAKLRCLMECSGFTYSVFQNALEEERCKFISRVERITMWNQMLGLRSDVEEFRICFDLTESHSPWINKWLSYALSRNIKKLELIFDIVFWSRDSYKHVYNFPYKNGNFPPNFKLLKHMSFYLVNVCNGDVRFILEKCTLLEHLSLHRSDMLTSVLEIVETYPSFKSLEIGSCLNLGSVVFRDSGIVTLKYKGRVIPFVFDNVPHLTQLWTSYMRYEENIDMFSPLFSRLEMLIIYFPCYDLSAYVMERWFLRVKMHKLKQLVVCLGSEWNDMNYLLPLVNLIRGAPVLHRLVVEESHRPADQPPQYESKDNTEVITSRRKIKQLKEVEFVGYRGSFRQLDLIKHFVHKAVALENLIVDTRSCFLLYSRFFLGYYISVDKSDDEVSARRDYATKQLQDHVPSRINLKIL